MKYVFPTEKLKRYRFPTHINDLVVDWADAETSEVFIVVLGPGEAPPLHQHDDTEQVFYAPLAPARNRGYFSNMTQAVAHILEEVGQLSEAEQRELRRAIVERLPVSDDLTDEDFGMLAAASFRALDEEEDAPA